MLKTFIQLLGDDAPVFRRYCAMAIARRTRRVDDHGAGAGLGRLLSADVEARPCGCWCCWPGCLPAGAGVARWKRRACAWA
jgi:hypothetical protein